MSAARVPSYREIDAEARRKAEEHAKAADRRRARERIGELPEWVKLDTVSKCPHWRAGRTRYYCELCNPQPLTTRYETAPYQPGIPADPIQVGETTYSIQTYTPARDADYATSSPHPEGVSPLRRRVWGLAKGLRANVADPAGSPVAECVACRRRFDASGFLALALVRQEPGHELRVCPCAEPILAPSARLQGSYPLSRPRIANCRFARAGEGGVSLKIEPHESRPFFSGLQHCGSVWECPTCAAAICHGRAEQLEGLLERHGRDRALFLTLTIRHAYGDDLRLLTRRLSLAWRAFTRGEPWKRLARRLGIVGAVRALELTHGRNGWHPHLHILWLTRDPVARADVLRYEDTDGRERLRYGPGSGDALADRGVADDGAPLPLTASLELSAEVAQLYARWSTMVGRYLDPWARCPHCAEDYTEAEWDALLCHHCQARPGNCAASRCSAACPDHGACRCRVRRCRCGEGFAALDHPSPDRGHHLPDSEHGIDLVPITDARYLAKMGLELAELTGKQARAAHRTPWQIAVDLSRPDPSRADAALWRDYVGAMRGMRKLTFSRGLLRRYDLLELDDDDLAADEQPDTAALHVADLSPSMWDAIRGRTLRGVPLPALLLDLAARRGFEGVRRLLSRVSASASGRSPLDPAVVIGPPPPIGDTS